jgi:hypothetical protein
MRVSGLIQLCLGLAVEISLGLDKRAGNMKSKFWQLGETMTEGL